MEARNGQLSNASSSSWRSEEISDMRSSSSEATTHPTIYSCKANDQVPTSSYEETQHEYDADSSSSCSDDNQSYATEILDDDRSEDDQADDESSEEDDDEPIQLDSGEGAGKFPISQTEPQTVFLDNLGYLPSNPRNFHRYFPTRNQLRIRHDDTTIDGNLNLRLDSQYVLPSLRKIPLAMFHLRMHDLRCRRFSLRRYCRESGREVCNSRLSFLPCTRLGFPKNISRKLHPRRRHQLKYQDEEDEEQYAETILPHYATNIIKLEFANYANIRLVRMKNEYKFEYWGQVFNWKKSLDDKGNRAFRLSVSGGTEKQKNKPCACIVQDSLSPSEAKDEGDKGGWVPPSSFYFLEDNIIFNPDLADVIVATGLISLVDDCIRIKWRSSELSGRPSLLRASTNGTTDKPNKANIGYYVSSSWRDMNPMALIRQIIGSIHLRPYSAFFRRA